MSRLAIKVGQRIKELRKRSGYTLEELGARLGMKGHSVWRLETGRRTPSLELLENLGEIMDVSPAYFLGENPPDAAAGLDPDGLDPVLRNLWEELNQRLHHEHPITREQAAAIFQAILNAVRGFEPSPVEVPSARQ